MVLILFSRIIHSTMNNYTKKKKKITEQQFIV